MALLAVGADRLGVPLYGIVAGLGVGGLAIALAAQPTVENLLGGLSLFADKPVRVGDFCKYGDGLGIVESIGIRSTRIRGTDRTLTTIPNAALAKMPIVNFTRRDQMLIQTVVGLRYETTPEQLRYVLVKLREMLLGHPRVSPDPARARFVGFGDSSLNIEVYAYVMTRDWAEFLGIREDVLLRVMDIVEQGGGRSRFPRGRCISVRDRMPDENKAQAAEAKVREWREEGSLPFPNFSPEQVDRIRGSIPYTPRRYHRGHRGETGVAQRFAWGARCRRRWRPMTAAAASGRTGMRAISQYAKPGHGAWLSPSSRGTCASPRTGILFAVILSLSGCAGPVALHKAVLGYDHTVSLTQQEMLLLNIARQRDGIPAHFTVTSSIAATFDFRASIGAGLIYNDTPGLYKPSLDIGASVAESPTLSIVPLQGREFTERVLQPVDESKLEFLVFQGSPLDMVMRLMADGIEVQTPQGGFERFILNWPSRPREYEEFRRIALHLAWLNANRKLFVGRLSFVETTPAVLDSPPSGAEVRAAAEKDYRWVQAKAGGPYLLKRRVTGRVAITNYDPRTLSDEERAALNAKAAQNPANFVLVDIRPDRPGGNWPLFGALKLRSFNQMLDFVGRGPRIRRSEGSAHR